jgi:hypothetical protein
MSGRGENVVTCSEWSDADLAKIEAADELDRYATLGRTLRPAVLAVDGCVYVRTWHRRNTWALCKLRADD